MAADDLADVVSISDEELEVRRRRYQEAREAGLTIAEASMFCDSSTDIGQLRRLVIRGCPPAFIAQIIL